MISRRTLVAGGFAMIGVAAAPPLLSATGGRFGSLDASFARLEKDCNGRLGVAVLDTGSGDSISYREDERFAMCSTFNKSDERLRSVSELRETLVVDWIASGGMQKLSIVWLFPDFTRDRPGHPSGSRRSFAAYSAGDNNRLGFERGGERV
jgi:hypothetical protein